MRRPSPLVPALTTCTALAACTALALLLAAGPAHAGRSCAARPTTLQHLERSMALAQQTASALQASGARVVLLARAGQDLSPYGVHYSHLGWAYRTEAGAWRVVHKLNTCGTAQAALYRQGLGEFFLDDLWRYEAVYQVLAPAVQAQLLAVLQDNTQAQHLHQSAYSMVSYAWGQRYQQSNQWALETLAAALQPGTDTSRSQAQAWLRAQGYQPAVLKISALTRLGARMTAANVAFDDHPPAQRWSDRIETVTVDSVLAWLTRAQLAGPAQHLTTPEGAKLASKQIQSLVQ